jgi:hypothetical protein
MAVSRDTMIGVGAALVLAVAAATGPPWWFKAVGLESTHSSSPPTGEGVGMSGGCAPFQVFAQGRWRPRGAAIRAAPSVLSTQVGSFPANMSISVNGWVYGRPAYPTNVAPWNNGVWYHLTDGVGWVSFAGVRATPVAFDPTGLADGGPPAPIASSCEGAVH